MKDFQLKADKLAGELKQEFKTTDPDMKISFEKGSATKVISVEDSQKLVDFMNIIPSQVLRVSQDVAGLTESSMNFGKIRFSADKINEAFINILARSSINSYLPYINSTLESLARLAGYAYKGMIDPYGGWAPNPQSPLLKSALKHYSEVLKMKVEDVKYEAIHAGLECGELISLFPNMEAISIGPTIRNPHSD